MVKSISCKLLLILVICAVAVQPSEGATWVVEKGGSGDFTVIQDALDAAAADLACNTIDSFLFFIVFLVL